MKALVLGDTHGHTLWKTLIEKEKPDKVIMLGDYLDSFGVSVEDQLLNFTDILKTQEEWGKDKFILCLGNHDYHYMYPVRYSGYKSSTYNHVKDILKEAWESCKIIPFYIEDKIIFSHAGISEYWLENVSTIHKIEDINNESLDLGVLDWNSIKGYDSYGGTISNSPIWIRPWALTTDMLPGYTQVVGHTTTKKIVNEGRLWTVDALPREYLIIEDGKFIIKQIENGE